MFPADHGVHPAARIEWWYVSGAVQIDAPALRCYSQPQLRVSGSLTRDGIAQPVRGTGWLDHQWSD